jgi:hypothetical protein
MAGYILSSTSIATAREIYQVNSFYFAVLSALAQVLVTYDHFPILHDSISEQE